MATAREKQLLEENRALKIALEKSQAENALLRQKVDLLIRKVFGASSEKIDPSQIDLFLVEPENAPGKTSASSALEEAEPSPSRRAATPRAHRWPQELPVVEEVIDPAEVKEAPEQWRCIGSEISEQLDYEPGRFLRRRLVRRKYVSRVGVDAVPVIASLPPMLQQRSGVAPGLLAQNRREQVRSSSAALPAGTNLLEAKPGVVAETKPGSLGRTGGGVAETDLRAHPHRSHGRRLRSG